MVNDREGGRKTMRMDKKRKVKYKDVFVKYY